ncbi:antibiotic biosynthesis monooxygenase [Hazenella sp. IB182357]|uniref:Antibiotic biosynthesis monooxygenase n=1 Tax=Polycladospora coralii TaxID=2771432 RepID=A0A926RSD8_9BACL|nr:antibiotic biosynthesis monooxygenase [Polycladospora coralii]MBD1371010.1 antibiotic biosynthesis monooxygenase [Polycladospora coralii]MBS7529949.1 antibiotic biosynthesis monooxygenase [Polycladospora coralii]
MYVQIKKIKVTEGNAELFVQRFSKEGIIEKQDGFVDLQVMVKKTRKEEEVIIMVRWESYDLWKKWETSEEHLAGHRANRGKPKQDYVISSENAYYDLKVNKKHSSR